MRILVLQHAWVEAPGVLDAALSRDAHPRTHVHLDHGEHAPALDDFDALWVLGGPMDVSDEATCPWLAREKRLIREAVRERGLAYLGICLGHQLLAEALGGRSAPSARPEQGVFPITLTEAGRASPALAGFGSDADVLQNHSHHVTEVPPECTVLARSERSPVQALGAGPRVLSVQFHLESPPEHAVRWLDDETLAPAMLRSPGLRDANDPVAALREHVTRGNERAGGLYRAWQRGLEPKAAA